MVSFVQQPIAGGPGCWDSQWHGATCRWRWSWSFEITQNKTKLNTTDFWRSLPKILSSSVFQSMHYVFSYYQNLIRMVTSASIFFTYYYFRARYLGISLISVLLLINIWVRGKIKFTIELVRLCHTIMLNHSNSEFNTHSNSKSDFFLLKAVLFNVNIGENFCK